MKSAYTIIIVGILVLLLYGCLQAGNLPSNQTGGGTGTGTGITESMCTQYGGHWNPCGSACRGEPSDTACIEMCVPYCECGGIAGFGCPPSYICTDYLPSQGTPDAMGICKKVSE